MESYHSLNMREPQQYLRANDDDDDDDRVKSKFKSNKRRIITTKVATTTTATATTTMSPSAAATTTVPSTGKISPTSDSSSKAGSKTNQRQKKRRKKYYYSNSNNNIIYYDDRDRHEDGKHKGRRRMNELFSGVFIYVICVSAPVVFGIVVKWYEHYLAFQSYKRGETGEYHTMGMNMNMNMNMNMAYDDDGYYDTDHDDSILRPQNQNFFSFLFTSSSTTTPSSTSSSSTTPSSSSSFSSSSSSSSGKSYFFSQEYLLNLITKIIFNIHSNPSFGTHKIIDKVTTFFYSYSRDMRFIIIATVAQSLVRVILVHWLVPRCLVPRRLVAFVRNKSSHLLSSSAYDWPSVATGTGTGIGAASGLGGGADPIDIHQQRGGGVQGPRRLSKRQEFLHYCNDKLTHTGLSFRRSLGHETEAVSNSATAAASSSPSVSPTRRNSTLASSMPSSFGNTPLSSQSQSSSADHYDQLAATQALRLFAAPRYATAIFRLICCFLSCTWALSHFRKASYWPFWVGGSMNGSTKYCWDLSGSIDPSFVLHKDQSHYHPRQQQEHQHQYGYQKQEYIHRDYSHNQNSLFDFDFDNQNSALRYFFLGQASYQLQSLCFHFLSMIVLLIYGRGGSSGLNISRHGITNNNGGGVVILSARSSFKSYLLPVVEHSLYLILTITTFFFSALRRLGSISIFALELSSLTLQLLQMCINAPESSSLRKPRFIQAVHHYVAIPVFVYCRFFIIPFVVQYSAIFESSVWLRQMDHAFLPGCGVLIYYFFNGTLLLMFLLNFIYLRRLIFHPHVQDILR